jgi:hypothetical protein
MAVFPVDRLMASGMTLSSDEPRAVAALFVRADSCYFDLAGVDCWDVARDARSYADLVPVVVHPPCRAWGRLRHRAKPRDDEKALALFAVDVVRRVGGVLEHPHASTLWATAGLPLPGQRDAFGGFTLLVDQGWWGHPAPKPTWLYVVGCDPSEVPALPVQLQRAGGRTTNLSSSGRERTPVNFARWLVSLARCCYVDLVRGGAAGALTECGVQLHRPGERAARKRASFREWAAAL